jgi:hypothetical protein
MLLPLIAIALSLLLPSVVKAESTVTPAANSGFSMAKKGKRLAKQHRHVLPDSPKDLTESNDGLDDASAEFSTRPDPPPSSFFLHTSYFSLTRSAGNVPAFLFPTHSSSDSLHEYIRERAPPSAI